MSRRISGGSERRGEFFVIEVADPEGGAEGSGGGVGGAFARSESLCWWRRNMQWSQRGTSVLMGHMKAWVAVLSSAASIGGIEEIENPGC